MKPLFRIMFIVAVFGLATFSFANDKAEAETKKLAGIWIVKRLQIEGVEASADLRNKMRVTIEGNQMTVKGFEATDVKNSFTLNMSTKPVEIDLQPMRKQVPPAKGIYSFDGTTLSICVSDGETRPKDFSTKPKTGQVLMVLERAQ